MKMLLAITLFVCCTALAAEESQYWQDGIARDGDTPMFIDRYLDSDDGGTPMFVDTYLDSESLMVAAAIQAMLSTDYPSPETPDDAPGTAGTTLVNTAIDSANNSSTDPSSIVKSIYHDNVAVWPADEEDSSPLLSTRLSASIAVSQRTYGQFFLMFDPVVNGQDAKIEGLVVHPAVLDGNRAYVNVRFRNFDQDNALVYSFVKENDGWKLDELASISGESRWLLTDVLRNP